VSMVKILSLIVFIAAFILSWCAFNTKSDIGIDVHAAIQSKLAILIQDTIQNKRPNSDNFKLLKMYTEKIDDLKIKAYFSYKFEDQLPSEDGQSNEKTNQTISGTAVLSKGLSEDSLIQKWILQSVKTGSESIDFAEGLTITTNNTTSDTSEQAAPEEAAPATEHK
jgi:hypothetical protein